MLKSQLRKQAYNYIKVQLNVLGGKIHNADPALVIPLDDIMLLREGQADPSSELVVSIKQLLKDSVAEAEIDTYLVAPFK